MAGHNKWSKIKNSKGAADQKRGKLFTKLGKELVVAARLGGGNADTNPRLRQALLAAKQASMPKDNIDRAIKKGTGELQSEAIEEITYEGYGPAGVAILVEATTDNRNRTVSDLRNLFKSGGGSLGESGSVAWMFDYYGQLNFEGAAADTVMEVALESGAQDVVESSESIEVRTAPADVYRVKDVFDRVGMHPSGVGFTFVPKNTVALTESEAGRRVIELLQSLEDHDDVQRVHANFEMDDKLLSDLTA